MDGLPGVSSFDGKKRTLLVMDDLMTSTADRVVESLQKLVMTEIFDQKYLLQKKQTRTLNLNSHYIVMFKNACDATQVANLARQMYPVKVHL